MGTFENAFMETLIKLAKKSKSTLKTDHSGLSKARARIQSKINSRQFHPQMERMLRTKIDIKRKKINPRSAAYNKTLKDGGKASLINQAAAKRIQGKMRAGALTGKDSAKLVGKLQQKRPERNAYAPIKGLRVNGQPKPKAVTPKAVTPKAVTPKASVKPKARAKFKPNRMADGAINAKVRRGSISYDRAAKLLNANKANSQEAKRAAAEAAWVKSQSAKAAKPKRKAVINAKMVQQEAKRPKKKPFTMPAVQIPTGPMPLPVKIIKRNKKARPDYAGTMA